MLSKGWLLKKKTAHCSKWFRTQDCLIGSQAEALKFTTQPPEQLTTRDKWKLYLNILFANTLRKRDIEYREQNNRNHDSSVQSGGSWKKKTAAISNSGSFQEKIKRVLVMQRVLWEKTMTRNGHCNHVFSTQIFKSGHALECTQQQHHNLSARTEVQKGQRLTSDSVKIHHYLTRTELEHIAIEGLHRYDHTVQVTSRRKIDIFEVRACMD